MTFRELVEKDLRDYKGKTLELKELPDGASSKHYKLTVGKKYKIIDVDGSNLVVKADDGSRASFAASRFKM